MSFKEGDEIQATDNHYAQTRKINEWRGIVVSVRNDSIDAETIHTTTHYITKGKRFNSLLTEHFELVTPEITNWRKELQ